jgi:hypothetical protein
MLIKLSQKRETEKGGCERNKEERKKESKKEEMLWDYRDEGSV